MHRKSLKYDEKTSQYVLDSTDNENESPRIFKHDDKVFKVRNPMNNAQMAL